MKDQIARVSMTCLLKDITATVYVVLNVFSLSSHILLFRPHPWIPNDFILFQAILVKENDARSLQKVLHVQCIIK